MNNMVKGKHNNELIVLWECHNESLNQTMQSAFNNQYQYELPPPSKWLIIFISI